MTITSRRALLLGIGAALCAPGVGGIGDGCIIHLLNDDELELRRVSDELHRNGFVITDIDLGALAGYCQAYGRWMQAERLISDRSGDQ